jgi:hypothetical protein
MGNTAKAKIVEAPPEPDRFTVVTSELLLAINKAVFDLKRMPDLSPKRAARATILQCLLLNVRARLMEV